MRKKSDKDRHAAIRKKGKDDDIPIIEQMI